MTQQNSKENANNGGNAPNAVMYGVENSYLSGKPRWSKDDENKKTGPVIIKPRSDKKTPTDSESITREINRENDSADRERFKTAIKLKMEMVEQAEIKYEKTKTELEYEKEGLEKLLEMSVEEWSVANQQSFRVLNDWFSFAMANEANRNNMKMNSLLIREEAERMAMAAYEKKCRENGY